MQQGLNRFQLLGALCVAVFSVISLGAALAQTPRQVTIGLSSSSLGAAGYRLSNELGLFAKHGIEPRFIIMDSGSAVTTALIAGSVQLALAGGGELVAAHARGMDIVAGTNSYAGTSAVMVLSKAVADKLGVKPDAPIADRLKALDGLMIATTSPTSSTTISYQAAAKRNGATFRSTFTAQPAMPAALESGAVQGFASAAPFWALPLLRGTGVLWISGPKGELPIDLQTATANHVQAMGPFARANPDLMRAMDAIYRDFAKTLDERPQDVKAAISKLFPDLDRQTIDLLFDMESQGWKAKPLTPADIEKEIRFIKMSGVAMQGLDAIDPAKAIYKAP
jgi:ABC-type nitrate/sulfonate/bicarbonate transport system substrate-binding protein